MTIVVSINRAVTDATDHIHRMRRKVDPLRYFSFSAFSRTCILILVFKSIILRFNALPPNFPENVAVYLPPLADDAIYLRRPKLNFVPSSTLLAKIY